MWGILFRIIGLLVTLSPLIFSWVMNDDFYLSLVLFIFGGCLASLGGIFGDLLDEQNLM